MIDILGEEGEEFTDKEKIFCEYWLRFHTTLFSKLTLPTFTTRSLGKLIIYECFTRKRNFVIDRLLGRYFKLRRKEAFKLLIELIRRNENDTGEGYRDISSTSGEKARWPSG